MKGLFRWPKAIGTAVLVGGLLLSTTSAHAWDTLSLNLKSDLRNWEGILVTSGTQQATHKLEGGRLVLGVHGIASRSGSGSRSAANMATLDRGRYADLRSIEVTAKIDSAKFRGCAANGGKGVATLGATATWFNNGSTSGGRDGTGNIKSRIQLTYEPGDRKAIVRATAWRCEDSDCNNITRLGSGWVSLGKVNIGSDALMRMTHNRTTNTIVLASKIGNRTRTKSVALTGDSRVGPPADEPTIVEARAWTPNCSSGARPYTDVQGRIRKIRVRTYE